jgi:phosphoglycerate dehydrogenase-like enzyme
MATLRLGILDDYQNVTRAVADWGRLPAHVQVTVFTDHVEGEELVRRLVPFEILVIHRERTPFPRQLVERLPNLKLLVTTGMRNLSVDMDACRERGILVCGTESSGATTVELTWALILAAARHIVTEDAGLRAGKWQTTVGVGLAGKTLGVLGIGRVGTQVARVGAAFGMQVIAWSQNLTDDRAAAAGCVRVDRDEFFRRSDILTVHVVLSERTRGLIARRELALMKPDAILVNTSRGPIVDEAALIDALTTGALAGAALDVYDVEPLPADAPILRAPNTVLAPHLGYVTRDAYAVYFGQALEDVEAWLAGRPVRVIAQPAKPADPVAASSPR